MSKFKIKMKIQGFEVEIEGSKEDIPSIANNLSGQIAGLLQPSADIVQGSSPQRYGQHLTINSSASDIPSKRKSRGKKRAGAESQGNGPDTTPIDWKHDSAKYGTPRQDWNAGSKALWILYVAQQEIGITQLSAPAITDIFNRKFKQAGTIRGSNVSRDLGNLKVKNHPGLVGDDTTKPAVEWFLTDAGTAKVQEMIAGMLTPASAA